MAETRTLVLEMGTSLDSKLPAPFLARSHVDSGLDLRSWRNERSIEHSGCRECMDDADQSSNRHADNGRSHATRYQGSGLRSWRNRKNRGADRNCTEGHSWNYERIRRAHDRWILPRFRPEARPTRPLRTDSGRRERCTDVGYRGRASYYHR